MNVFIIYGVMGMYITVLPDPSLAFLCLTFLYLGEGSGRVHCISGLERWSIGLEADSTAVHEWSCMSFQ